MSAWGQAFGGAWADSWGPVGAAPAIQAPDTAKTKRKKKVRGPYSDPRIYEAYIERCIAERQAPRGNVEVAVLKEALIDAVQERRQADAAELEAITKENELLHRLIAMEKVRRNVESITARQRQISARIEELEDDEARAVITLLDEM